MSEYDKSSNGKKGEWRKKIVKKGGHKKHTKQKKDIPLNRILLIIFLILILGFAGFNLVLYLMELIF